MEAVVPTVWLWRRYFGRKPDGRRFLKIQDWRLEVIEGSRREPGRKPVTSVPAVLDEIELVFSDVRKWVPLAVVSNGVVAVQGKDIRIADARWEEEILNARVSFEQRKEIATIRLAAAKKFPWELNVAVPELSFESQWKISKTANAASLQGEALWRSNTIQMTAQLDRRELAAGHCRLSSRKSPASAGPNQARGLWGCDRITGGRVEGATIPNQSDGGRPTA
jgi:hypothetical protein